MRRYVRAQNKSVTERRVSVEVEEFLEGEKREDFRILDKDIENILLEIPEKEQREAFLLELLEVLEKMEKGF